VCHINWRYIMNTKIARIFLFSLLAMVACSGGEKDPAPDTTPEDMAVTDYTGTDATVVDATVEDATVPDATVVDATVEDATVPDATVVDATVEDATVPDATVVDATVEDATVPDATVVDATVEDATVPDATVVDATVEDATVPDATVVDATVEDATVPDATVEDASIESDAIEDGSIPVFTGFVNGGFEAGQEGWSVQPANAENVTIMPNGANFFASEDTFTTYAGQNSGKIYGQYTGTSNASRIFQTFTIQPPEEGQKFELGAWFFVASQEPFTGMSQGGLYFTSNGEHAYNNVGANIPTNQWIWKTGCHTITTTTFKAGVRYIQDVENTHGTLFFDDVSIVPVDECP
jgi:hypothetical protein